MTINLKTLLPLILPALTVVISLLVSNSHQALPANSRNTPITAIDTDSVAAAKEIQTPTLTISYTAQQLREAHATRDALLRELKLARLYDKADEAAIRQLAIEELQARRERWETYRANQEATRSTPPLTPRERTERRITALHRYRLTETGIDPATLDTVVQALVDNDLRRIQIRQLAHEDRQPYFSHEILSDEEVISGYLSASQTAMYRASEEQYINNNRLSNAMAIVNRDSGPLSPDAKDLLAQGEAARIQAQMENPSPAGSELDQSLHAIEDINRLEAWFNSRVSESDRQGAWFFFETSRLNWEQNYALRHLNN